MMKIRSKQGSYGWRSIVIDTINKIKVVGLNAKSKAGSRTLARVAHSKTLKQQNDEIRLNK